MKGPWTAKNASRNELADVAVCPKYLDRLNYPKYIKLPQLLNTPLAS